MYNTHDDDYVLELWQVMFETYDVNLPNIIIYTMSNDVSMDKKMRKKMNNMRAHAIDYTCHIFYILKMIIGSLGSPNTHIFPLIYSTIIHCTFIEIIRARSAALYYALYVVPI